MACCVVSATIVRSTPTKCFHRDVVVEIVTDIVEYIFQRYGISVSSEIVALCRASVIDLDVLRLALECYTARCYITAVFRLYFYNNHVSAKCFFTYDGGFKSVARIGRDSNVIGHCFACQFGAVAPFDRPSDGFVWSVGR